jgi:hypothetical protein
MRIALGLLACIVIACGGAKPPPAEPAVVAPPADGPAEVAAPGSGPSHEPIAADEPRKTARGVPYVAPAGWRLITSGLITILDVEGADVQVAIVDADGADADAAVASAWQLFRSTPPPSGATPVTDAVQRGWDRRVSYRYPDEGRLVTADALQRGGVWTVVILEQAAGIPRERASQAVQILNSLLAQP